MDFGKKIKNLRQERGYTQEELGKLLNVSRSTISSWEIGRTFPDIEMIFQISRILDISIDFLLNDDEKIVENLIADNSQRKLLKSLYKVIIGCVLLFMILSSAWLIKNAHDYSFAKSWNNYARYYTKNFKDIECLVPKAKYLDINNKKEMFSFVSSEGIEWHFKEKENPYATINITINTKGEGEEVFTIHLDKSFKLISKMLSSDEVVHYSKNELEEIEKYLDKNMKLIEESYSQSRDIWKDVVLN